MEGVGRVSACREGFPLRLGVTLLVCVSLLATPGYAGALSAETSPVASATGTAAMPPGIRVQESDRRLERAGPWVAGTSAGASGGAYVYAHRAGSTLTLHFRGTRVALIGPVGPSYGRAEVYLNGRLMNRVSQYAPVYAHQRVVWQMSGLADTAHTVTVRVLGARVAASTGTVVVIDGFDVANDTGGGTEVYRTRIRVQESDRRLERAGPWVAGTSAGASGGAYVYAHRAGSTLTLHFRGTRVALIGPVGPSYGRAEVYLNGRLMNRVSQYAPVYAHQRVVWQMSGLADTAHTVTVRVLGARVAASTGTVVVIDGFDVISDTGSVVAVRDMRVRHHHPWRQYIVIDKSEFRLYWYRDGRLVKTYPVAHGRVSAPTPSAIWRIDSKYFSDPRGIFGPRRMRLYRQTRRADGTITYVYTRYLIHGTSNPASIGTRASAGCIRMYNRDVLELFPQVPLGTMVVTQE